MQPVRNVTVTEAEAGQKLLQFLERRLGGRVPKALIQRWVRKGEVRVDKGRAKPFDRLEVGQMVRIPPFRGEGDATPAGPSGAAVGRAGASVRNGEARGGEGASAGKRGPDAGKSGATIGRRAFSGTWEGPGPSGSRGACDAAVAPGPPTAVDTANAAGPAARRGALGMRVVYEDADVLALSKPAGLPSQGGTGHDDSVAARLRAAFVDAPFLPTIAHRLDRDTTGLLAVGKSYAGLRRLQEALAGKERGGALKIYFAWVEGRWSGSGVARLEDFLEKGGAPGAERMRAGGGKVALAEVAPLRVEAGRSLVAVRLLTGRTHQIRAQLAARGHPVAGDRKYGGRLRTPLKLHAFVLDAAGLVLSDPPPWDGDWAARDGADIAPDRVREFFRA